LTEWHKKRSTSGKKRKREGEEVDPEEEEYPDVEKKDVSEAKV
jgi:hypothetical protein